MNIPITAYLVSAFVGFENALYVYRLNRQSKLNRIYTAFAGSYVIYSIVMIQFFLSADEQACWFWYRLFTVLACIFLTLGLRYFMELAGIKAVRSRIFLVAFYALPVIFALPSITFTPLITGFVSFPWGWGLIVKESIWTLIFYLYMMGSNVICTALAINWRLKTETQREKKMALIIMLSSMAGNLGLVQLFLPAAYPEARPAVIIHVYYVFCFLVLVFGIRYAIKKYGLMTIAPENAASRLFEGIHEALFVINDSGEIIFRNENARILRQRSGHGADPKNIFELFTSQEILEQAVDELLNGRELKQPVILTGASNAGGLTLETTLLGIKNEVNKIIGFIIIVREAGGIPDLQEQHRLSPREIELLLLLCSGLSTQEIAQECEITFKTAKTHIHNIYRKTGLKNRVELSNLLNKHL